MKNKEILFLIDNISPIYKSYNYDKNHLILLLNKKKYKLLFETCENLQKYKLEYFNNTNIHKNMKHSRIKFNDLTYTINNIYKIYKLHNII